MKIGDMVKPNSNQTWLNHDAIGVIVDSRVSSLRRDDQALNVNSHHVYWSVPKTQVMWVMERDLEKAA